MSKFLKDFLLLFILCIVLALIFNWLLGKPYFLNDTNVILSLVCSLTTLWVAAESKRRAQ